MRKKQPHLIWLPVTSAKPSAVQQKPTRWQLGLRSTKNQSERILASIAFLPFERLRLDPKRVVTDVATVVLPSAKTEVGDPNLFILCQLSSCAFEFRLILR